MSHAFFRADGGGFVATELTRGPWDDSLQHGGPPAALIGRAFEKLCASTREARGGGERGGTPSERSMRVARVTVELLRPIPIGAVTVRAELVRQGKKAAWMTATLLAGDREACRASALAVRRDSIELPPGETSAPAFPPIGSAKPFVFPFFRTPVGYHTAMELRWARGTWGEGAAAVWMRQRVPLVAGETPSPLQRVLVVADAGNGVSLALPIDRYTFINPDLTVHLHREPDGEWIGLDATTTPEANGGGLAQSHLHDSRGAIGRSLQSLVVERR